MAAFPTRAWKNSGSVYNGKDRMVPKPLYSEGFVFLKNVTVLGPRNRQRRRAEERRGPEEDHADAQSATRRASRAWLGGRLEHGRWLQRRQLRAVLRRAQLLAARRERQADAELRIRGVQSGGRFRARSVRRGHVPSELADALQRSQRARGLRGWSLGVVVGRLCDGMERSVASGALGQSAVRGPHDPAVLGGRRPEASALPQRGAPRRNHDQEVPAPSASGRCCAS